MVVVVVAVVVVVVVIIIILVVVAVVLVNERGLTYSHMSILVSTYLLTYNSILSADRSTYASICLRICPSIHPSVYQSIDQSSQPSNHPSINLTVLTSTYTTQMKVHNFHPHLYKYILDPVSGLTFRLQDFKVLNV